MNRILIFFSFVSFFFFFYKDFGISSIRDFEKSTKRKGEERKVEEIFIERTSIFLSFTQYFLATHSRLSFGKTYCASHANSTRRIRVILFLIEKPLHDNFLAGSKLDRLFPPFLLPRFLMLQPFDTKIFSNSLIIFFIEGKKKMISSILWFSGIILSFIERIIRDELFIYKNIHKKIPYLLMIFFFFIFHVNIVTLNMELQRIYLTIVVYWSSREWMHVSN